MQTWISHLLWCFSRLLTKHLPFDNSSCVIIFKGVNYSNGCQLFCVCRWQVFFIHSSWTSRSLWPNHPLERSLDHASVETCSRLSVRQHSHSETSRADAFDRIIRCTACQGGTDLNISLTPLYKATSLSTSSSTVTVWNSHNIMATSYTCESTWIYVSFVLFFRSA